MGIHPITWVDGEISGVINLLVRLLIQARCQSILKIIGNTSRRQASESPELRWSKQYQWTCKSVINEFHDFGYKNEVNVFYHCEEIKMKQLKALFLSLVLGVSGIAYATSVDEIIDTYFENTGGKANWAKLKGFKMHGDFQQGQMKFPLEIVQLADGRQYVKVSFQGKEFTQMAFDGSTMWSMNMMSMKPEKSETEDTENMKQEIKDFPNPFLNYKEKGFKAELLGKETIDGAEAYKIKLTKKPILVDGKKVDNVVTYYFDTEAMIPVLIENELKKGPAKGMIQQIKPSDYQEVSGYYFPFTITQGIKGKGEAPMAFKKIEQPDLELINTILPWSDIIQKSSSEHLGNVKILNILKEFRYQLK